MRTSLMCSDLEWRMTKLHVEREKWDLLHRTNQQRGEYQVTNVLGCPCVSNTDCVIKIKRGLDAWKEFSPVPAYPILG